MELDNLQIKIDANASQANKSINNLVKKLLTLSSSLSSVDTGKLNNIATGIKNISDSATGFKGGKSKELISLSNALRKFSGIDTNSIYGVSSAMQNLARGIGSVGNVNVSGMSNLISSVSKLGGKNATQGAKNLVLIKDDLVRFVQGMNSIGSLNFDTSGLSSLIGNIARLGSKSTTQATKNLPAMSAQLQNFVRQMNAIGSSKFDSSSLLGLANAISRLGGKSATQAIANLPALTRELSNLFTTLSRSPSVSSNIIQMTNALANLARSGSRSGTAVRSLSSSLNSYSSSASKATKNSKGLVSQIGMFYAKFFLAVRGIKQLWKAIESSMDYVEVLNYFNAAFGQVADNAVSQWSEAGYDSAEAYYDSFAKRAEQLTQKMTGYSVSESGMLESTGTKNMGIDPTSLMNYQAMFGQMSSSMGITSENALTLSNVLTEIGADLASVKNMDFNKVWEDMASGLAGMSRTLDKYGVNIRNVNLQTKLNELGIQANITALNQNEKALLRTIILLDSTTYAWGDLSDTINQPANQLRLLQSNFSNLARTIGNIFLPIVAKVLPYLNGLAIALQRVAENIVKMLGFKDFDWGGLGGTKGASDALSNIYDEADDTSDALDNATDSAKELKNQLMSFDEVDKLTEPTENSNSGTSSGSGLDAAGSAALDKAFQDAASAYQKAWDEAFANMEQSATKYADKIEKALKPLEKMFEDMIIGDWFSVGEDVSNIVSGIFDFFSKAISKVDWYQIGRNMGEFLAGINWTKIFFSIGKFVWSSINASIDYWKGMFDVAPIETMFLTLLALPAIVGFGESIVGFIVNPFKNAISTLTSLIAPITTPIMEMFSLWIGGAGSLGECFMAVFGAGGVIAIALAALVAGLGITYSKNEDVQKGFAESVKVIEDGLKPAMELISGTVLPDLNKAWDKLIEILKPFGNFLNDVFVSIWQDMINPALSYTGKTIIPNLTKVFENFWKNILVPLGNFLSEVLKPAIKIVSDALDILWKDIVIPLANAIGNVLGKAFEGVCSIFNNVVAPAANELIGVFSFLWNSVLSPLVNFLDYSFRPEFEYAFSALGGLIDGLGKAFGGLIEFITGSFATDWKMAWNGIIDVFKGIFSGILSFAKNIINYLIDGINKLIKGLNGIVSKVGDVIGVDIEIPEIKSFTIQAYAVGGFPEDGLFFANHNELVGQFSNGKTAVANNEEITAGIERAAYNGMKRALAESNNSNNVNISLEANTAGLFRAVQKEADNYTRRTGESAFVF